MSYVLTDDDYAKLYSVKQQLGLLSSLLSRPSEVHCDSEELDNTICALKEPISQVLKTLEKRSEIARQSESMKPSDWARIITLVSGRDSMSVAEIVKMDDKLATAVEIDPAMECVFNAWRNVMTDDGQNPMMKNRNDMGGFHVKFERTVQPEIPPATEQSILEMYHAKNARELLKHLVAMSNVHPA